MSTTSPASRPGAGPPGAGPPRAGRQPTERGSATVYLLVACVVLAFAAVLVVQVAALARLQHQVTAAADLSALAASRASVAGRDACAAAERIALANGAELVSCRMAVDVATVKVAGESRRIWGRRWTIGRTARAGPADYLTGER